MHSPLRLLLIVPTIDPAGRLSAGGAERFARSLCLAFDRQRVAPLLVTYEPAGAVGEELRSAGIECLTVPKSGKLSLATIKALKTIIRDNSVDAVLSLHHGVNLYNLLATYRSPRVACVIRLGRVGVPFKIQLTEGLLSLQADALICNSAEAAQAVRGIYTIPPSRTHIIPNGCDIQRFSYVPYERRRELRAQLDLPEDAFILYTPNRIHTYKGQDLLAAALATMPEELQQHDVLWVNTGLAQQPELLDRIKAALTGIARHARLLPAVENPEAWIAASDAVVIPSRTESFPNVMLEASAVGRPLLTTARGAATKVGHELGALVVNPESHLALAHGIKHLLAMAESLRATKGQYACDIVRQRYTIEAVAGQYSDVIEQAAARRRR